MWQIRLIQMKLKSQKDQFTSYTKTNLNYFFMFDIEEKWFEQTLVKLTFVEIWPD